MGVTNYCIIFNNSVRTLSARLLASAQICECMGGPQNPPNICQIPPIKMLVLNNKDTSFLSMLLGTFSIMVHSKLIYFDR